MLPSVHSDLGGGEDGHLGIVCIPALYLTLVPNDKPYVQPGNPSCLEVDLCMTQYEIAQKRNEHAEETQVFREVIGVKQAICQLVTAIKPKHLRALRSLGTNKLTQTISEIFDHLFTTYGDVTPQAFKKLGHALQLSSQSHSPATTHCQVQQGN